MSGTRKEQPEDNPSYFPELNLYKLKGLAKSWAQEYPIIQRIVLYPAHKEVVSAEYVILVHISRVPAKLDEADEKTVDYLSWQFGWDESHIIGSLKSAYTINQQVLVIGMNGSG